MVRIAVLASFNMDLVMRAERQPRPGETLQGHFAMHLGGNGFNQAVAARRLGGDVAVIGRVGDDAFGRAFLDALDREGIDRTCVTVDPHEGTGAASIVVTPDGENAIIQAPRANDHLELESCFTTPAELAVIQSAALLVTLETPEAFNREVMHTASHTGAIVVLNTAPASRINSGHAYGADIIVSNRIEAEALSGLRVTTPQRAIDAADRANLHGRAVVTMGADGAVARLDHRTHVHAPSFAVDVVDTTGAGDAFCGALALSVAEGADLRDAVRFACAAGAVACTRHGAEPSMPYRAEVEALMERAPQR